MIHYYFYHSEHVSVYPVFYVIPSSDNSISLQEISITRMKLSLFLIHTCLFSESKR